MSSKKKAPSLLSLCIERQKTLLHRLRDVSGVDDYILEHLLPRCTVEQLAVIENCTKLRDISSVTNDLWKKFFKIEFGNESVDSIVQSKGGQTFKWKEIYEAKTKERELAATAKLKRGYAETQKHSRQIKRTPYVPPKGSRKKIWRRK